MKNAEARYYPNSRPLTTQTVFNERHSADQRARFALDLARSLSVVGIPDGVSASGEQLFRLCETNEVIARSTEITEKLYAELERRGWLIDTPSLDELESIEETRFPGFRATG